MTRKRVMRAAVVGVVMGSFCFFVGFIAAGDTEPRTVTVPGPVEEVEVVKEVTPDSCYEAIEEAREIMKIAAKGAGVSKGFVNLIVDGVEAGFERDPVRLEQVTDRMTTLTEKITGLTVELNNSTFQENALDCESGS